MYFQYLRPTLSLIAWSVLIFAYNSPTHATESEGSNEADTSLAIHKENIVVLLDASGSMNDPFSVTNQDNESITKIQVAKEALETVLTQLTEDVNIGLLVFSVAHSDPWLYPLGMKDEVRFLSALSSVEAGGGTPLAQYMKSGADTLLAQRERQFNYGSYRLLIITDGQAKSAELVNTYTSAIKDRQIRIDVIGVDMEEEHTLATVVDSYRRADNPEQLVEAVAKVLAETSTDTQNGNNSQFDLLQPLTEELALSLIKALTKAPSNQPIRAEEEKVESVRPQNVDQTARNTNKSSSSDSPKDTLILIGFLILSGVIFFIFRSRQKPN